MDVLILVIVLIVAVCVVILRAVLRINKAIDQRKEANTLLAETVRQNSEIIKLLETIVLQNKEARIAQKRAA